MAVTSITHGGNIFAAAGQQGVSWKQVLDFSASINPLGPSPAAKEAILSALDRIAHYPDRTSWPLRERLALEWGVRPEMLIAGNGATELLFDWCRHFGTGIIAAPAFSEFHRAWPEAQLCLLADPSTWPDKGPLVLTRPANPTGKLIDCETVLRYSQSRRDAVLVDESFIDFCSSESLTAQAGGNLYVLRSLTKFWALPGLRIGVLVGDVDILAASRPPWAVNALAEAAALASIEDRQHAASSIAFVKEERSWLARELGALPGLKVWDPTANFLFAEVPTSAEWTRFASARGVLIRDCVGWPGFDVKGLRMAVRKRWENEILVSVLKDYLCASA